MPSGQCSVALSIGGELKYFDRYYAYEFLKDTG